MKSKSSEIIDRYITVVEDDPSYKMVLSAGIYKFYHNGQLVYTGSRKEEVKNNNWDYTPVDKLHDLREEVKTIEDGYVKRPRVEGFTGYDLDWFLAWSPELGYDTNLHYHRDDEYIMNSQALVRIELSDAIYYFTKSGIPQWREKFQPQYIQDKGNPTAWRQVESWTIRYGK